MPTRAKAGDTHNMKISGGKYRGQICDGVWEPHIDKDGDSCLKCSKCGAVRYNQGLGVL